MSSYRIRLDFMVLLYTVMIVARVKQPMDYHGVMEFLDRHSRSRGRVSRRSGADAVEASTANAREIAESA